MRNNIFIILFLFLFSACSEETVSIKDVSPSADWTSEIESLKLKAHKHPNLDSLVLFVGSSTFTGWKNMDSYFPSLNIINNGFGGSQVCDIIYYYSELIEWLNPSVLVLYYGDNDLFTKLPLPVLIDRQDILLNMIKVRNSRSKIILLSPKYSPKRDHVRSAYNNFIEYNSKRYEDSNIVYLNINTFLLDTNGEYDYSNYASDLLHLSPKGYSQFSDTLSTIIHSLLNDSLNDLELQ